MKTKEKKPKVGWSFGAGHYWKHYYPFGFDLDFGFEFQPKWKQYRFNFQLILFGIDIININAHYTGDVQYEGYVRYGAGIHLVLLNFYFNAYHLIKAVKVK